MLDINRRQFNRILGLGGLSALAPPSVFAGMAGAAGEAGAPLFKLSFSSWCFHMALWRGEMQARDLPGIARDLGVDALEWTAKTFRDLSGGTEMMFQAPPPAFFRDLRKAADDAGVDNKVLNVGGPFFLASADPVVQQKALDYVLQYVEPAQVMGSRVLRTEVYYDGERGPGWEQKSLENAAEGVHRLLEKTRDSGLVINAENHHGISSHPDWLAGLVEAVDSPRFRLTADTNNFRVDQDNPYDRDFSSLPQYVDRYEGLRTLMPYANWVSAKCYAFDSTGYEISIDYPRILEIILASGYRGYISVEYEGAGDPLEGVRQSIAMFRTLRGHFSTAA